MSSQNYIVFSEFDQSEIEKIQDNQWVDNLLSESDSDYEKESIESSKEKQQSDSATILEIWKKAAEKQQRKQMKMDHFNRERTRVLFLQKDDPLLIKTPWIQMTPVTNKSTTS
jgi:hypothetical protein